MPDEVFFRLKGLDDAIKRHLGCYAAALDLASTASGNAKAIYLSKTQDALRAMSKWLQEKQMTALEVTYGGRTKPLQDWVRGVAMRDKAHLGAEERINFRDVVNVVSGIALAGHFADIAPEYPAFSVLVTETNRKQLVASALRHLAGGPRTKDAIAILDALEMLDGDRIDLSASPYAQEVLSRLKARGHGQVLNRSEFFVVEPASSRHGHRNDWLEASPTEYFAPARFRLEPDLLVTVLAGLVYSGDIVLAIAGDKIDSGKLAQLAAHSQEDLKAFKCIEAPKEINVAVLRALFVLLGLSPGLAQLASVGSEEPVKQLQQAVGEQVARVLAASTDMQGRLAFWGQPMLRDDELRD